MKRFLLPASALVLVVTACGAGARPAPRATQVEARVPSMRVLIAERERAALREARALEAEFVPPPGARRDPARRDHGGILHHPGDRPYGKTAAALRFWRVRKPLSAVAAFLRAHDPRGYRLLSSSSGTERPGGSRYRTRTVVQTLSRYLDETIVARPGRTVIRVEAIVAWVYPRSPREKVPAATRTIVAHGPNLSRVVKSPSDVARIVHWFDDLPVYPPGTAIVCPLVVRPEITLSFRSAANAQLALARVPTPRAGICQPMRFSIGGKARRPLLDHTTGESFARRLEGLLRR